METQKQLGEQNGYLGFFQGKQVEVWASTSFEAHKKLCVQLKIKPSKQYLAHVHLCERSDGTQVVHTADF